jgi:hypothetical protein
VRAASLRDRRRAFRARVLTKEVSGGRAGSTPVTPTIG